MCTDFTVYQLFNNSANTLFEHFSMNFDTISGDSPVISNEIVDELATFIVCLCDRTSAAFSCAIITFPCSKSRNIIVY